MMIPSRCSAAVIGLPVMAIIMDMPIIKIHNGPVQFYQQQMLDIWNLARKFQMHGK